MITLNLLDKKRKKERLVRRVLLTVQKNIEIFFFFILIIGIILSTAQYFLQESFELVTEQTTFINKNIAHFNQEIVDVNKKLQEINIIQKDYLAWSPVLIEITNTIPSDVQLESLIINKESNLLEIKGTATTRDNFLTMKKNLENIYFISQIDSPLTNLLKKENLDFNLSITLDLDRLNYD